MELVQVWIEDCEPRDAHHASCQLFFKRAVGRIG
jgi:hypothetical protein